MVKINGHFGIGEAAYVPALVSREGLSIAGWVSFLIDTGASRTIILDGDARALNLAYESLQRYQPGAVGVGGVVETYIIENCTLTFSSDLGDYIEPMPVIYVLRHGRFDRRVERLPSLLGRDIINKYNLFYGRPRGSVFLTDQSVRLT